MKAQAMLLSCFLLIAFYVAATGRSIFPVSNYNMFANTRFKSSIPHIEIRIWTGSYSSIATPKQLAPYLPHMLFRLVSAKRSKPEQLKAELQNIHRHLTSKIPNLQRSELLEVHYNPTVQDGVLLFERLNETTIATVSDEHVSQ